MSLIALDKQAHFLGGAALAAHAHVLGASLAQAFWVVLIAGLLKEVYDWFNSDTHSPDVRDLVATLLGYLPLWASVKLLHNFPEFFNHLWSYAP